MSVDTLTDNDPEFFAIDDLPLKEKQVKQGGVVKYILREASSEAVRIYRNANRQSTKYDSDGKLVSIGEDNQTLLLSQCLFDPSTHSDPAKYKTVPLQIIRSWPNRVTETLINWLLKASELIEPDNISNIDKQIDALQRRRKLLAEKQEENSAKKEQTAMTDGSA